MLLLKIGRIQASLKVKLNIIMASYSNPRKEPRDNCSINVEYSFISTDCNETDCGPWANVTTDVSFSGMGLYSNHEIKKGQKLNIYLKHVSIDPIVGEVRWCTQLSPELFKLGVSYR